MSNTYAVPVKPVQPYVPVLPKEFLEMLQGKK